LSLINDPQALTAALRQSGIWGVVVLVSLFILQVFIAFIPGQALMVASGYLYGFWAGTLVTWLSLSIGGELAFWLARRYGRPFAVRFIAPSVLEKWDRATAGQGLAFFTVSMVLPLFPNDAMCYVAGLGQIKPWRFLIANLLGRLIASLATAFIGAYGTSLPLSAWIGLALALGLGLLAWKYRSFF
jgi:uncharacterized membrane protein YdjX (TVP38/TMEM64 family)